MEGGGAELMCVSIAARKKSGRCRDKGKIAKRGQREVCSTHFKAVGGLGKPRHPHEVIHSVFGGKEECA